MYYLTFFNGKRKLLKQMECQSLAMLKGFALMNLKGKQVAVITEESTPLFYYQVVNGFPKSTEITNPIEWAKQMVFYK